MGEAGQERAAAPSGGPPRAVRPGARKLSREAITAVGIDLADEAGLAALSMRQVAARLNVDPMSLYHHVGGKAGLVEAMVDAVLGDLRSPQETHSDWRAGLRRLILSARASLVRHPWVPRVLEDRAEPTEAGFRYLDTVLGIMRSGGLSLELTHHALHVLGSRVYGFSQDLFDDRSDAPAPPAFPQAFLTEHPHIAELASAAAHGGPLGMCDDDDEFVFALDLILDALERRRTAEATPAAHTPAVL